MSDERNKKRGKVGLESMMIYYIVSLFTDRESTAGERKGAVICKLQEPRSQTQKHTLKMDNDMMYQLFYRKRRTR